MCALWHLCPHTAALTLRGRRPSFIKPTVRDAVIDAITHAHEYSPENEERDHDWQACRSARFSAPRDRTNSDA